MTDIKVNSFEELNKVLFEHSWQTKIKRHRTPFAFRGLSKDYSLSTTLLRLANGESEHLKLENNILDSFKKYATTAIDKLDNDWYWLTVAQHYGLPTRLMDWTYSPYVALHFMTVDFEHYQDDGVIWAIDYYKTTNFLPDEYKNLLDERENVMFTVDTLFKIAEDLSVLDGAKTPADKPPKFPVFFEPPSIDGRVVNQFALFSVFNDPNVFFDTWLQENGHDIPDLYRKIHVPAALKWEIRNKLDGLNINERVLFPGLDGLSQWLKRYYSLPPDGV